MMKSRGLGLGRGGGVGSTILGLLDRVKATLLLGRI